MEREEQVEPTIPLDECSARILNAPGDREHLQTIGPAAGPRRHRETRKIVCDPEAPHDVLRLVREHVHG